MPLVKPLSPEANLKVKELADFFNETLGFCPNSVLTMQIRPEVASAFIGLNKAVMENHGKVTSAFRRSFCQCSIAIHIWIFNRYRFWYFYYCDHKYINNNCFNTSSYL